jgi:hypothetical protein
MLHAGTFLKGHEKIFYGKMLTRLNEYFGKNNFDTQSYFKCVEDILSIDFRLGQHVIYSTFKGHKNSLEDVREYFHDINLELRHDRLFVDHAFVVSCCHARLMKQQRLFQKETLTVMDPPKQTAHYDPTALATVGQKFPDYIYGEKKYDLKTSNTHNFSADRGYVLCISDNNIFNEYVETLLRKQQKLYKDIPELARIFNEVLSDKNNTTWEERNDLLHTYFMNVLHKHPQVHPSLIFKHEVTPYVKEIKVPKYIETILSHYHQENEEIEHASERTLIESLQGKGGNPKRLIANYLAEPRSNKNILEALKKILLEDSLLNP